MLKHIEPYWNILKHIKTSIYHCHVISGHPGRPSPSLTSFVWLTAAWHESRNTPTSRRRGPAMESGLFVGPWHAMAIGAWFVFFVYGLLVVWNIFIPHITVWGSCFSLGSRRSPPSAAAAPLTHSLTHTHSLTLTHTHSHSLTHSLTVQIASWLPLAWQAQYTEPPGGAAARVGAAGAAAAFRVAGAVHRALLEELRRAWAPLGPRLPLAWQTQYTEPPGGAAARVGAAGAPAAFRMAGAVHRASWRSCGARGRRWGRGCLWRGRCSTQSLLEELRRAWAPLGPRLPLAWQAQYTEPPGGAAARVGAAAFRMAGAVHRASWRSCGCLLRGRCSTQSLLEELRRAWAPLGPRLPCDGRRSTHHNTTHHNLSHTNSSQLHFSHLTHHSSTAHHNSSQLHFSQVHFSSQLITTYHIPTHHSSTSHTSLLTPHLSHHNFSSHLITTYHIPTHHSSTSHTTSHTSLITSELITAPLLTPDITSPLLTPHFSHLPEVHIKLRYMKAWHVGLSGPLIFHNFSIYWEQYWLVVWNMNFIFPYIYIIYIYWE